MEYMNGVGLAFDYEITDGSIATASLVLDGLTVRLMAHLRREGRVLILSGVHVDAQGPRLTRARMQRIAQAVMEALDL